MKLTYFRQLQWQLTRSFTIVSSLLFVTTLAMILLIIAMLLAQNEQMDPTLPNLMVDLPQQAAPLWDDDVALQEWLDEMLRGQILSVRTVATTSFVGDVPFIALLHADGQVRAVSPQSAELDWQAAERIAINHARSGSALLSKLRTTPTQPSERTLLTFPVRDPQSETVLGVFVVALNPSSSVGNILQNLLSGGLVGAILLVAIMFVVSMIGSLAAARPLVKRLEKMASSAESWASGDLTQRIADPQKDEIASLSHNLDQMAGQLAQHMNTQTGMATLQERNRIARELHDAVKQQIFAAIMQLNAAKLHHPQQPDKVNAYLDQAEGLAQQAQEELTHLIHELRPIDLREQGLTRAIQTLTNRFSQQTHIPIQLTQQEQPHLSQTQEQALYRICQEALNNCRKHSHATEITVDLLADGANVILRVNDNGQGFDPVTAPQGIGLASMRERSEQIGGTFELTASPNQGTTLIVRCPYGG